MKKYEITLEIESEEPITNIDDLLEGSWLYDPDFRGAITDKNIKSIK